MKLTRNGGELGVFDGLVIIKDPLVYGFGP